MSPPILNIKDLSLTIGETKILHDIDLQLEHGQIAGIVGESGSGKSLTALSVMQLLPNASRTGGTIEFNGQNLLTLDENAMCALRGNEIGMVFQEPMTALNPVKTIGEQIREGIRWHTNASRAQAEERARSMLDRVGLPPSQYPLERYPHELSGGQRQRVVIAIATALNPKILIADEPTTALDVVLQAQILDLLKELVADNDMALILISHDLGVVADVADTITIMRKGVVEEAGSAVKVLKEQKHPYTAQLAEASIHMPAWQNRKKPASPEPLLEVSNLSKIYRGRRTGVFSHAPDFTAVDDVSFDIAAGRSIGLVGRSGCGKSTLARMVLGLSKPSNGKILFDNKTTTALDDTTMRASRRHMQVVFQDPYGSFNPRKTVEWLVAEPLFLEDEKLTRHQKQERIAAALNEVGLSADAMKKYPHEFSGGQRQRIAIARALITRPKLIVADEPVSALDVSIRAQVLDLLAKLNDDLGIAFLFITHDLSVARAITHEVMVMDKGKIVERGQTGDILDNPQMRPTQRLVEATPDLQQAIKRRSTAK
ncbi:ABC transporter ATP-binding protein [Ahrensia marina]|uniref:Microcin ABC transporter ATP-binding protein n=1 Tax=Ahrensia marina TaxID=1514904 RepID=A0A0N1J6L0_9HYPH|nr:dipeptide ABC transporter ATP-binding protein [Ahrensia marina]KPB02778.1 microcin ABC transporter ATP-binding protein [Ahrensia marina]